MQYLRAPVSTICIGMAASMASVLLAAGAKGKRYALPNSRIMIHQGIGRLPRLHAGRAHPGARARGAQQLGCTRSSPAHRPDRKKVAEDTERDYFMSPEAAKAYGIIDEVYAEPDQSLISEAKARA